MLPNMDPKTMMKLMNQMGIKSNEVDATKVIIEKTDGSSLVVTDPQVVEITMQGQKSYQVSGRVVESGAESGGKAEDASPDDVELVAAQANVSKEKAADALKKSGGDIAEAILLLEKEK